MTPWRRGSARAGLVATGGLACFLYVYASVALGAAYNDLLLAYIAISSMSLFGLAWALSRIDMSALALAVPRMPHRSLAAFLFVSAAVTAVIWLAGVVPDLVSGDTPELEGATTLVTHVLDLGVIAPAVAIAGLQVLRRSARGYLLAVPLLVIEVSLLPMIVAQTISQLAADVSFTTGEIVGPIGGFVVLAGMAAWMLARVVRAVSPAGTPLAPPARRPLARG
jgi:hypothetical protein